MSWAKTTVPGIYRDAGKFRVKWRDHTGRQRTTTCRTFAEAKRIKGSRDAGRTAPPTHVRFEAHARRWLATYKGRNGAPIKDATREAYRSAMERYAIPHLGAAKLDAIRPSDVKALIAKMQADGLSAATIRSYLVPLKALFAEAIEDDLLTRNPAAVRVTGGPKVVKAKVLTADEYARLRAEIPVEHHDLFDFLALTGCRIGEALGATWQRVTHDEHGRPAFLVREQATRATTKTQAGQRAVPLDPGFAQRLMRRRAAAKFARDGDPVFPSAAGTFMSDDNWRARVFRPAAKRAGLAWVVPHTLRHSFASLLLADGRTPMQVANALGHTDPAFTLKTYAHARDTGPALALAAVALG